MRALSLSRRSSHAYLLSVFFKSRCADVASVERHRVRAEFALAETVHNLGAHLRAERVDDRASAAHAREQCGILRRLDDVLRVILGVAGRQPTHSIKVSERVRSQHSLDSVQLSAQLGDARHGRHVVEVHRQLVDRAEQVGGVHVASFFGERFQLVRRGHEHRQPP